MISVIVPVYNRVGLLKKALASIFAQTYKDIEVVVVDDGGTEEWPSVIARSEATRQSKLLDNEIASSAKGLLAMTVIHQSNKGAPAARNRGLAEAKGDYVIFWDADIVGRPEMLEKLKKQLDENLKAGFSYCNYRLQVIGCGLQKKIRTRGFDVDALKHNNYIPTTSLIRRRDAIKWDEGLKRFQDWDLWLTMSEMGKTGVWVDEYLFEVLGGGTMSRWLPRFAYKAPFKWLPFVSRSVNRYEAAKKVIIEKHKLSTI